jgi:hypothetical protein
MWVAREARDSPLNNEGLKGGHASRRFPARKLHIARPASRLESVKPHCTII